MCVRTSGDRSSSTAAELHPSTAVTRPGAEVSVACQGPAGQSVQSISADYRMFLRINQAELSNGACSSSLVRLAEKWIYMGGTADLQKSKGEMCRFEECSVCFLTQSGETEQKLKCAENSGSLESRFNETRPIRRKERAEERVCQ